VKGVHIGGELGVGVRAGLSVARRGWDGEASHHMDAVADASIK